MDKRDVIPPLSQLEEELSRIRHKRQYAKTLRGTVSVLVIVAAVAVLAATLLFPVFNLHGSSMEPTLNNGELVLAVKNTTLKRGDIIAFYYNNKILVKRVMGFPGEIIDVQEDGTVVVNGEEIDEPYLTSKSFGECDIDFPYTVPENRYFVMGDLRETSLDSRTKEIGAIADEVIVGRIVFRFWPVGKWGAVG
ncbi:MAG: signal peptidase I [Oscillospiraceae bacterium]|jgi:signal peptidase I|nr:signal peptidase I [Oscillospiraceae bacterium]